MSKHELSVYSLNLAESMDSFPKLVLSGKVVAREKETEERNHRISMMVPGSVVEGTVESIMPYGAFVSLGNGISGLVHISQLDVKRTENVTDVVNVGDIIRVKVMEIDNQGRINLSRKDALADIEAKRKAQENS